MHEQIYTSFTGFHNTLKLPCEHTIRNADVFFITALCEITIAWKNSAFPISYKYFVERGNFIVIENKRHFIFSLYIHIQYVTSRQSQSVLVTDRCPDLIVEGLRDPVASPGSAGWTCGESRNDKEIMVSISRL